MAKKKGYLSRLSKGVRHEVDVIMRERDGALTFPRLVARCWDLGTHFQSPFRTEAERVGQLDETRASLGRHRPAWTAAQVDDFIRLASVTVHLPEIAIARRCALDDPGELGRLLTASHRLLGTALCDERNRPSPEQVCAVGNVPLARQLVAGRSAGFTAVVARENLYADAVYALLQQDRPAFERLVGMLPTRGIQPWQEGIYLALQGVAAGRPGEVAQGLSLMVAWMRRNPWKDVRQGAVNFQAHGLYRLLEWVSPELVSAFDATQPYPWDADLHAWVSAHPDPVAGWDLSDTPPLIQQIVGRGEVPDWLRPAGGPRYEIVLLGGDPRSRPLLEEVERLAGGDGSLKSAKRILDRCPAVLRWGFEEESRGWLDAASQRLEACGGQSEVRPMGPGVCRHFLPPVEP